jgi:serine/threonine protein kinase
LIAIKQLFSPDETEFLKERTILKSLGHKKHPHLIKLLATYKQGNKYHLMFPYANANLRTYWDKRPTPEFNKDTVLWSLKQMKGIANGLFLIHNFTVTYPLAVEGGIRVQGDGQLSVKKDEELFGRHGDMKPENILWFDHTTGTQDPMGVLQIADFGLGRFHGRESRSRVNPDTIVSSPTYEPPECKLRRPVSRAYDIWSLGCIFLEFVTWLLKGSAEIDGFADFRGRDATDTGINEDNFFTIISKIEGTEAVIREEVQQWVDQLHEHERCSAVIHELLNLVMDGLLKISSTDRFEASHIYQQLLVYLKKAEFDEEYLLKPVPRQEKPVNERANSTPEVRRDPQVDPTTPNGRNSDSENAQPIPRVHAVTQSHATLPRDLVLRNAGTPGTPSFRRNDNTWPMTRPLQMND